MNARKLLAELGYKNIFIKAGDGFEGWREHAPFDKIILTCAVKEIPPALIEQLKEGGRIIAPIGATGRCSNWFWQQRQTESLNTNRCCR